ncbi:MAG TPA: anion permease [Clostridiales bacterium UBA8153]|nr:anion permease [Clostridiales bacterium UBA8153]
MQKWWRILAPLALGGIVLLFPVPQGLTIAAWRFLALFVAVVAALVFEPLPGAVVGLTGITVAVVTGIVDHRPGEAIRWALAGFSDGTVWLIFLAFMLALGYEKTGLGRRLALSIVKALGRKTIGLGYATALADLALAPFTPSNTARSAGTIYPVIRQLPGLYGSEPGESARKLGSYVMWNAFAGMCVSSSLFMTGMAPNILAVGMITRAAGFTITWTEWFMGFLPVGLLLAATLPLIIYKLYPPTVKRSEEVPKWAGRELEKLGRLSVREISMLLVAVLALGLWIFARDHITATAVALLAFSLMLLSRVVTWDDVLDNRPAWNALIWFATLVTMAGGLSRLNIIAWVGRTISGALAGLSVTMIMATLAVVFFFIHYMFASITAHTVALLPMFLAVGLAIPDFPVKPYAMLLAYTLGLMGVLTPYATGPAPVYYGSGFLSRRDFWGLGLIFGCIFIVVLLVIGMPYLMAIHG